MKQICLSYEIVRYIGIRFAFLVRVVGGRGDLGLNIDEKEIPWRSDITSFFEEPTSQIMPGTRVGTPTVFLFWI